MKCNCSSRSGAQQKSYPAACTSRSVAFEPSFTGRVWCSAAVQLLMYLGHGSAKESRAGFGLRPSSVANWGTHGKGDWREQPQLKLLN